MIACAARRSVEIVTSRRRITLGDGATTATIRAHGQCTVTRSQVTTQYPQVTLTPLSTITWTLLLSVYVLFAVRVNGAIARRYTLGLYAVRVKYRVFLHCPHSHRMPSLRLRTTATWTRHDQSLIAVLVASVRLGARESSNVRFRWVSARSSTFRQRIRWMKSRFHIFCVPTLSNVV